MRKSLFIGLRVVLFRTNKLYIHHRKQLLPTQTVKEGFSHDLRLFSDVEAGQNNGHAVTISPQIVDTDFGGAGGWFPLDALNPNPVDIFLGNIDGIETSCHVRRQISGFPDFIQQLSGYRSNRDKPAGVGMLCNDRGSILFKFCNGKPYIPERGYFLNKRVIASGCLGTAFYHMAGHRRTRQCIPVCFLPFELPGRGSHDQCCIGDTPPNDNVCTMIQCLHNPPATQISIG